MPKTTMTLNTATANAVSNVANIQGALGLAVFARMNAGGSNPVIGVQISPDDENPINWYDLNDTITATVGANAQRTYSPVIANFARLRTVTAGAGSTAAELAIITG